MEEILNLLVTTQSLEDEIKETKLQCTEIPKKIVDLEKEIEKANLSFKEKTERIKEIKKTYKTKEGDIAENETKIIKFNSQTFSVKTNEEYRAIISEIEFLKKENKKTEDEMINFLEEEEKLKATIDKSEKETEEFINKRMAEIANLKQKNEELMEKQKKTELSFEENFDKLPADTKQVYKRINKVRGKVVCIITDNTCSGCYANLTHQFLNELKKRNKILLCGNCGRILVYLEK